MIRLGFIGFGLIGASIAKTVKVKTPGKYDIYVYDYHTGANEALEKAETDGVISAHSKNFNDIYNNDVIILCAPTLKNLDYLKMLADNVPEDILAASSGTSGTDITDTDSTDAGTSGTDVTDTDSTDADSTDADSTDAGTSDITADAEATSARKTFGRFPTLPLITDVGSVKGNIAEAAAELGIADRFIGGHPMAGSEKSGYDNATDHLFENAYYILTPTGVSRDEDIELLRNLATDLGAINITLDPARHDKITSVISHVPHIVAVELVNLMMNAEEDSDTMRLLAAGGFKDITRIASSSPDMWESIFISNKDAVLETLDRLQDGLVRVEAAVLSGDGSYINSDFKNAGEYRAQIPDSTGMLAKSHKIYIDIEDKVGAIATIATTLVVSGINIKNIGIVHNRDYEQGALRVDFYDDESADKAEEALRKHGYTVYPHK